MNNSTSLVSLVGHPSILPILLSVIIVIAAVIIGKALGFYLKRTFSDRISEGNAEIISKAVYYSVIIFTIVFVLLPAMGIEASSFLVAGGILGIIIGFASQSIVGNLISGLFLIVERPIEIGQQVDIGGNVGIVEDISIISTIIRTYDGLYVRIPNEKVFTSDITNYVANVARRFEYKVGVRYSDDADRAIGIIKKMIDDHPLALKNPAPQLFVSELADNAVTIVVRIWSPATDWYSLKTEMLWKIKKTLEENGIEIAFPQRTVWFANELSLKEKSYDSKDNTIGK